MRWCWPYSAHGCSTAGKGWPRAIEGQGVRASAPSAGCVKGEMCPLCFQSVGGIPAGFRFQQAPRQFLENRPHEAYDLPDKAVPYPRGARHEGGEWRRLRNSEVRINPDEGYVRRASTNPARASPAADPARLPGIPHHPTGPPVSSPGRSGPMDAFLTTIERVGNRVPHPAIIFFWLIGVVILLSVILGFTGWSATYEYVDPVTHEVGTRTTTVRSLLSADGIRFMFTSIVGNFLGFGAVGVIVVAMIGVGLAGES